MTDTYILPLGAKEATIESSGGKGASLAKLRQSGFPVPDGFHVTTAAYKAFTAANGLDAVISEALKEARPDDVATLEKASARIREAFTAGRIPDEIAAAVGSAYEKFDDQETFTAVRSSATAEDLPDLSFAGQQETFLNIKGSEAVLDAVRKCWASLWTARAIGYRLRNNIPQDVVSLAVVVQELVPAEAAGVMFTANPANGRRNEILINSVFGLGEAIVGGGVTPDTFVVEKEKGEIISSEIARKEAMTVRVAGGTEEQAVPAEKQLKPSITETQALALAELGKEIEDLYGMPMDIEWAIEGGEIAILQARPITALPMADEWSVPDPKGTYARGSLAEHIPSPVAPLFRTMGLRIANEATNRMYDTFMGEEKDKQWFIGGNMYLPINLYVYAGFKLTLKDAGPLFRISIKQTGPIMRGSVARWHKAREKFGQIVDEWENKDIDSFSPSELLESARIVFDAASEYYTVVQTILPAVSTSEMFFQKYYKWFVKKKTDPEFTTFLFGFDTLPVRSEKSLYDIAKWIKENPALADYFSRSDSADVERCIAEKRTPRGVASEVWEALILRIEDHFEKFGRTAYEFDFSMPTPAENPRPQIEAVRMFLADDAPNPYERHSKAESARTAAETAVLSRLGFLRKKPFTKLLRWAQETGAVREDSLADMGLGHPFIRRVLLRLGGMFSDAGALNQNDDIFWLEEAEVASMVAALENGQPLPDKRAEVLDRKKEWDAALKLTPPVALPEKTILHKFLNKGAAQEIDGKTVMRGTGTSQGVVTAPARVLHGPQDFGQMQPGDVLVATTTTPAWTPLFTLASAVVTDIGGPLSHSSIVAREYGIPAVMAVRDASRIIQSGEMITVDGKAGTVMLER